MNLKGQKKVLCGHIKFKGERIVKPKNLSENGGAVKEMSILYISEWHFLMDIPPRQSLRTATTQKHLWLEVLTGICALVKSPLLCSQLLFLFQVEDEAGFPHLTPYSWGKKHGKGGLCTGHVFWSQSSEDGQTDLGVVKWWWQISKGYS